MLTKDETIIVALMLHNNITAREAIEKAKNPKLDFKHLTKSHFEHMIGKKIGSRKDNNDSPLLRRLGM